MQGGKEVQAKAAFRRLHGGRGATEIEAANGPCCALQTGVQAGARAICKCLTCAFCKKTGHYPEHLRRRAHLGSLHGGEGFGKKSLRGHFFGNYESRIIAGATCRRGMARLSACGMDNVGWVHFDGALYEVSPVGVQ